VIAAAHRDTRAAAAVGREARLELVFERRAGRTILAHTYAEPPYRVGRAFELGDAAYVIIACTGAGVFAGDTLRQSIHVAPGARAVLASQSALQVHPAVAATPASVRYDVRLDDGAELHAHWDPLIPFAAARIDQRIDLHLAETASLYWSDALMAGRVTRGEVWRFAELAHQLTLRVGGSLRYLERYSLRPSAAEPSRAWIAADATYLNTALLRSSAATAAASDAIQRALAAATPVQGAVDLVEPRLIVARLMANCGAAFARGRTVLRDAAVDAIFPGAAVVGRK
jgi:urease accessory protein